MVACLVSRSTMALQQAQLLLNMSSLEPVNFGVHQNNTEAFAVALCHLAELHAEQVRHLRHAGGHSLGRFYYLLSSAFVERTLNQAGGEGTRRLMQLLLFSMQGLYGATAEILQHLKEQFPPHTQHAKVFTPLIYV